MRRGFLPRKILGRTFVLLFLRSHPPPPPMRHPHSFQRIQYVDCVPLRLLKVVHRFGGVSSAFNETRTSHKKSRDSLYDFFSDLILANWISKTSSLPFLNHMDANNSQFRLALLSNDGSTSERDSRQEEIESEATANIKRSDSLTSAQKRALIVKRLIPLVISLMILGGAVAARFLIPLP